MRRNRIEKILSDLHYLRRELFAMALFTFLKNKLKYIGLIGAFLIVVLILWNTYILFQNLKNEERKKIVLWAQAQEELIKNPSPSLLFFEILQQTGINPMIQVNDNQKIIGIKNIPWVPRQDDSLSLYKTLERIKKENTPIAIEYRDSTGRLLINQKIYYGDSVMLKKLQYYPMALFLIIFLFGAVLYFGFKTSKIAEQNRLWVAMAKETAHQIGTPLSSMLGWTTLMREKQKESLPLKEIEKDIDRLQIITDRFSKIGSKPNLNTGDIVFLIQNTLDYLQKRSSEHVQFNITLPHYPIFISHNPQLIGWTLENLIKNGIDAMKGRGTIDVELIDSEKQIDILIADTGSGIKKEALKNIFSPGFTTKKRGWGLGLSLAKRIIVDYHKGTIAVQKTVLGQGTCFQISLKKI